MDKVIFDTVTKYAKEHDIEVEAALAIVDVESAGQAFWNVNGKMLPIIRYEGHYFYARVHDKATRDLAVAQGLASPKAGGIPNPASASNRYELLNRARALDETAALESTSWGLGQVMGANWQSLGYSSVNDLVDAASTIEGQIDMMFRYIDVNGLTDDVNSHNWLGFKNGYNGKRSNGYDKKLKDSYSKFKNAKLPENDETMQLQKMLNALGDYKLTLDGIYGGATKAAVRDFQLKNNLTVDGIYGNITREFIEKLYLAKNAQATTNTGMGTAGIGTVGTALSDAAKQIQGFATTSQIIQYVFIGLIVVGALVSAYGIWKALKK